MRTFFFIAAAAALIFPAAAQTNWSVTSPNGQIKISLYLEPKASPSGGALFYRVEHGPENSRTTVLADSPLGLALEGRDGASGQDFRQLQFDRVTSQDTIEESYEMVHGKRRICKNRAQQVILAFNNIPPGGGRNPFEIAIRAYDDGVAFRYRLPAASGMRTVAEEHTGFALPANARMWAAPSDKPTMYAPAYETYYQMGVAAGTRAPLGFGWSFPLLFKASDKWALITEGAVGTNYCASRLSNDPANGVYRIRFADPAEGHGKGNVRPSFNGDWDMPWRVIIIGDSLAGIVESTLVTDVSPASRVKDTSWIKPGRVAWSWWSDQPSPQDGAKQKKFIDLAAAMGWEYMLVDANWDLMDNGNIHDVLRYAKEKNVGVLLWYNSGGPHNVVTEKPRDTLTYPEVRRFELELLSKWGVKGIKVDFFQSDKQDVISLYHGILKDAADAKIMINFHGCTLPRGWERTWPHLMSMEAVRGEECYIFDPKYPEEAPVQSTVLPFTRNVVGPMDYTPVSFSTNRYPRRSTAAHELALSVVFESGWLHFADKAEAYLNLPPAPKEFLKTVPVAWDDTRFLAGEPGEFVVLARRKRDTWYFAGINGVNKPREERIRLTPAIGGGQLTRIGDGADQNSFSNDTISVEPGGTITVKFAPYGGFVGTIFPQR